MKVNIDELQIKRANNRESIADMKYEYGYGMDEITYKSFRQTVPFSIANGAVVILHNGKPISMCIYGERTIYGVCTDEEYRNNGICHLLMKECIELMKESLLEKGIDSIKLFSYNPVAQKIYESMGFVCTSEHFGKKYYELKI